MKLFEKMVLLEMGLNKYLQFTFEFKVPHYFILTMGIIKYSQNK